MAKFSKIAKLFRNLGNRIINKFETEVCYKKMLNYHEQMDFYAFIDAIEFLLDKCYEVRDDGDLEVNGVDRMGEFLEAFRKAKKPLCYF